MFGSCWSDVAVITELDAAPPGEAGGVRTITGIDEIPVPTTTPRWVVVVDEASAEPVVKFTAAKPVSTLTA